ncbi:MAG TPA: hypothetical protein DIV57_15020 [Stenotrophomonas sp.]|nr:hypothetical protein [Stenotrophomonas sp.]
MRPLGRFLFMLQGEQEMVRKKEEKRYSITSSPLYGLSSKKKFAELLKIDLADLRFLAKFGDSNFKVWSTAQKLVDEVAGLPAKKSRVVQQPKIVLSVVHRRIAEYLSRIERPEFLHSATKGRSYLTNAMVHAWNMPGCKIDIKEFYPSVKRNLVKSFFENRLKCTHDVASFAADLCTYNGALPTGSAVSPILSFFACLEMFERIDLLARQRDLRFSLYVDDMFFSGDKADKGMAKSVVDLLSRHGFVGHKVVCFSANETKLITGVAINGCETSIPNARQNKMRLFSRALRRERNRERAILLAQALVGQFREAERLQPGTKARALPFERRLIKLKGAEKKTVSVVRRRRRRSRPKVLTSTLLRAIALMRAAPKIVNV